MTLKERNEALDALRAHYLGSKKAPGLIMTEWADSFARVQELQAEWRQARLDLPDAKG